MSLETFLQRFAEVDWITAHNLRCDMVARAIKFIGDSIKVGDCWCFPKRDKGGYGVSSVRGDTVVTSRLILCCDTGKPYNYHNENGEFMVAAHKTPVICRHRSCLNPAHLYWETQTENNKRRLAEARAREAAAALAEEIRMLSTGLPALLS